HGNAARGRGGPADRRAARCTGLATVGPARPRRTTPSPSVHGRGGRACPSTLTKASRPTSFDPDGTKPGQTPWRPRLHEAARKPRPPRRRRPLPRASPSEDRVRTARRSEEHTSELQSRANLVCRLLLE